MKYKFFSLLFSVFAASMLLVSCDVISITDQVVLTVAIEGSVEPKSPDFYAEIVDNFSNKSVTRSSISPTPNEDGTYSLSWSAGDEISISEGYNSAIYTTDVASATSKFTKKSGYISSAASKYIAFYPATLTPKNQKLPSVQEYVYGDVKNYPMYAESDGYNLSFKNLCGILRFSLRNVEAERSIAVKSISVSDDNKGLSGDFTIDESSAAIVTGRDGVILKCESPVVLGTVAKDFNIVVPKGEYETMKIKITTEDGKIVNLEGKSAVNINRSGITRVNVALKPADFTNALEVITFTDSDVEFNER